MNKSYSKDPKIVKLIFPPKNINYDKLCWRVKFGFQFVFNFQNKVNTKHRTELVFLLVRVGEGL